MNSSFPLQQNNPKLSSNSSVAPYSCLILVNNHGELYVGIHRELQQLTYSLGVLSSPTGDQEEIKKILVISTTQLSRKRERWETRHNRIRMEVELETRLLQLNPWHWWSYGHSQERGPPSTEASHTGGHMVTVRNMALPALKPARHQALKPPRRQALCWSPVICTATFWSNAHLSAFAWVNPVYIY